jgi:hypothetical protein
MKEPVQPGELNTQTAQNQNFLQPDTAPGDVPDFADEFTTSGTEKNFWNKPEVEIEKNTTELLI